MRKILVISLLIFSLCKEEEEEQLGGGWEKVSLNNKNYANMDEDISKAYVQALTLYSNRVGIKLDDIIPLTAYTQLVNGKNYKITFMDRGADYPAIHQYVFYKPLAVNNDGKEEYQLKNHKELEILDGLIDFDNPSFSLIENQLYKLLKKKEKMLKFVSYAYPVEDENTLFFVISAEIDDGHYLCVMGQDKRTNKFDLVKIIR